MKVSHPDKSNLSLIDDYSMKFIIGLPDNIKDIKSVRVVNEDKNIAYTINPLIGKGGLSGIRIMFDILESRFGKIYIDCESVDEIRDDKLSKILEN